VAGFLPPALNQMFYGFKLKIQNAYPSLELPVVIDGRNSLLVEVEVAHDKIFNAYVFVKSGFDFN